MTVLPEDQIVETADHRVIRAGWTRFGLTAADGRGGGLGVAGPPAIVAITTFV
jgi:hypothetical protein